MAIRLSGMVSGMDTDTLVSALVSSYSVKKDNLVKAQTKLSWKQEKWKAMNTSIYSFYSGKLSSARLSSSYNLKTASISNSAYAKVTAGSNAVNGTQTLKINKLAKTGYLTGGILKDASGNKADVKGSTKLSEIEGLKDLTSGSVSVAVDGKTTNIELSADMTVNQFTTALKSAGLNASFDDNNQRFFISSKTSGESHDFSITANDSDGLKTLDALKIFTTDKTTKAEYKKWAAYADIDESTEEGQKLAEEFAKIKEDAYNAAKISYSDTAKSHLDKYNQYKKAIDEFEKVYVDEDDKDKAAIDVATDKLEELNKQLEDTYGSYRKEVTEDDGTVTITYDTEAMKNDGLLDTYNTLTKNISTLEGNIKRYNENKDVLSKEAEYVEFDDNGNAKQAAEGSTAYDKIVSDVDAANDELKKKIDAQYNQKAAAGKVILANIENKKLGNSGDAVRVEGSDSEIELNGATFTSNTNNFSVNGLTIQATALTGTEGVTITTDTDVDGIYNSIKSFFKEYNELIKNIDTAYNADSSKGYEPLTDDEKEAMSDTEIEKWETKIKDSLLRKDATLGNLSSAMKSNMQSTFVINGKSYSLASFGISTSGYFASATNEKGVFHIDGDADDSSTSGNEDKLRAAIAADPDTVISFFSQLSTKVYNDLGKRMATSSTSSAYTIYNDKEMKTQYSEYNTKISDQEEKISTWEDYYYKKFSSMESALAKLNSQQSSISSYFS